MADFDLDYFPAHKSVKISSKKYKDYYLYVGVRLAFAIPVSKVTHKTVKTQLGDPGEDGQFDIIEERDGMFRIKGKLDYFMFQQYNSDAAAYEYGYNVQNEALFNIVALGGNNVAICNRKTDDVTKYLSVSSILHRVQFQQEFDESCMWIIHRIDESEANKGVNTKTNSAKPSQVAGKRPLPRDQELLRSDKTYDVIQYEAPRDPFVDIETLDGTHYQAIKDLIQDCVFGMISNKETEAAVFRWRGDVHLLSITDKLDGILYANYQLKVADMTVGVAKIQKGHVFGMRRIQRALCEAVLYQCVVRLSRSSIK